MWIIISNILKFKNLYLYITIFLTILGVIYFYKFKLNYLEQNYKNLEHKYEILYNNYKVLKQRSEELNQKLLIFKEQQKKIDAIMQKSKQQQEEVKKIIPRNKARISYDEQKKVINYLNSIFNDN